MDAKQRIFTIRRGTAPRRNRHRTDCSGLAREARGEREAREVREVREELAVESTIGDEILQTAHDYTDRRIVLHFLRCRITGTPIPQQGQEMRWVARHELATLPFPPADAQLIEVLTQAG